MTCLGVLSGERLFHLKKNMTAKLLADFLNNVFWTEEKKVEMFVHNA